MKQQIIIQINKQGFMQTFQSHTRFNKLQKLLRVILKAGTQNYQQTLILNLDLNLNFF
ncbi:unnamed protein product [Paramecium sonneborni]|uniref:Uncharacterized protein n=1 Tax=Paramecium sonneborni TaxID=65129 RepID=A0A8S1JWL9_9CILI|nr:unnamed protein product [Paramecium sonneborni]